MKLFRGVGICLNVHFLLLIQPLGGAGGGGGNALKRTGGGLTTKRGSYLNHRGLDLTVEPKLAAKQIGAMCESKSKKQVFKNHAITISRDTCWWGEIERWGKIRGEQETVIMTTAPNQKKAEGEQEKVQKKRPIQDPNIISGKSWRKCEDSGIRRNCKKEQRSETEIVSGQRGQGEGP